MGVHVVPFRCRGGGDADSKAADPPQTPAKGKEGTDGGTPEAAGPPKPVVDMALACDKRMKDCTKALQVQNEKLKKIITKKFNIPAEIRGDKLFDLLTSRTGLCCHYLGYELAMTGGGPLMIPLAPLSSAKARRSKPLHCSRPSWRRRSCRLTPRSSFPWKSSKVAARALAPPRQQMTSRSPS